MDYSFRSAGLVILMALLITALPATANSGDEKIGSGEAMIRFLGHCGFAVQTQNHFLIFDYVEKRPEDHYEQSDTRSLETGYINPEELRDQRVRVFVTHSHGDHYDQVIFDWEQAIPDIEYFFGWEASDESKYNYLVGPRAEWKDDEMQIYTVNSHHSGVPEVAYLVLVDGLAIYHNGDCKADPEEDIDYLKSKSDYLDLAFVPPVWEQKWEYYSITSELIKQLKPKALFPMHVRVGDEEKFFEPFENTFQPRMYTGKVILTRNEKGAAYSYKDGAIVRRN